MALTIWDNKISYFFKKIWISLNVNIFDSIQKRKLRKAILNEDFDKIYELIVNYERFAGSNDMTRKIKNYSIYNMINNKFINSTIMGKI